MAKPVTHQNVVRLDVGVHDLEAMQVLQRREHLLAVPDGSKEKEGTKRRQAHRAGARHMVRSPRNKNRAAGYSAT